MRKKLEENIKGTFELVTIWLARGFARFFRLCASIGRPISIFVERRESRRTIFAPDRPHVTIGV